jgi:CHASE1-domain containing sensor protein
MLLGMFLAAAISTTAGASPWARLDRFFTRHTAALAVLTACLTATALLWSAAREHTQRYETAQFQTSIETLRRSLLSRVERYEDALLTIRSALQVLGEDERAQWDQFSRLLTEKQLPPGIQFIGVVDMSDVADPAALANRGSASGVWQISRVADPSAEKPESEENRKRIAEWFASSEALEEAVKHARRNGRLGVGPLALRPAGETTFPNQPERGFFIALPLEGAAAARQINSSGGSQNSAPPSCLVAFVDSSTMIKALENSVSQEIDYQLFSGRQPQPLSLLEARSRNREGVPGTPLEHSVVMRVRGQDWTLLARSFAAATPFYQTLANQVLFGGLTTTALLLTIALRTSTPTVARQPSKKPMRIRSTSSESRCPPTSARRDRTGAYVAVMSFFEKPIRQRIW